MAARVSRRRLLASAAASAAASALGGAVALVRSGGYAAPDARVSLEPWQWVVVQHLARRVCAPDRSDVVTADETDVVGFVDRYAAGMPPRQRRDLFRFLRFVEDLAPATIGSATRFSRLSPDDQDRVLSALESSAFDLLRGGFEAVKALLFMGYYRDPRTWPILGYGGPLVSG